MKTEEYFEKLLKELEDRPDDKGHYALLYDIHELWKDALHHEFHDFKNTKYPTPKLELHKRLLEMDKKMQEGKYDN